MEHTFNHLTEDEIINLESEELEQIITEVRETGRLLNQMSHSIVGKKLIEIVYGYELESVGIDPHYEYNDEGFAGNFMININGEDVCMSGDGDESVPRYSKQAEDITYSELQQKIDDELAEISELITEYMSFDENDLNKLKVKSSYFKLEKELPTNESTSKIDSNRYKL
jgi:hypothetical protein